MLNKERIIQLHKGFLEVFGIKNEDCAVWGDAFLVLTGEKETTDRLHVDVDEKTFKALSEFGFEVRSVLMGLGHGYIIELNEITIHKNRWFSPTGNVDGITVVDYRCFNKRIPE